MGIFDASALQTKKIDNDEFRNELIRQVENILLKEFKEPNKRKVRNLKDSINFACPYCGDSHNNTLKKRAHLILNGKYVNLFKCFNCGKCVSITTFFHDFNTDLSLGSIDYINTHKADLSGSYEVAVQNISLLLNKDEYLKYSFDREYIKKALNVFEINDIQSDKAKNYLFNRAQYNVDKFLYSPASDMLLILNTIGKDKIIGIQFRDLSGTRKAKYLTFGLKKLHESLKTGIEIPDEVNTMSMLFNLFEVDITRPVIVLEGPMDSFLVKNSIASCGAFKNIKLDIDFWYLYDSDQAGNEQAIEKLKNGFYVFMWDNLKNDLCLPKRKKWDINDVVLFCKKNNLQYPNWRKYFTNDELAILDI